MANHNGNGKLRSAMLGVLIGLPVSMSGWALLEIASLKERAARGEAEREAYRDLMTSIRNDIREMRSDVKRLLER